MDQHVFVAWCLDQYRKDDITPDCYKFEGAHYPLPKGMGEDKIPLVHRHHAIQGIWQSEEIGRRCFHNGPTGKALKAADYWPLGLFDAWDLYDKWTSVSNKKAAKKGGLAAKEKGVGIHAMSKDDLAAVGAKGMETQKSLGTGIYGMTTEQLKAAGSAGGITSGNQKWISTADGFISTHGNVSQHNFVIGALRECRVLLTHEQYELVKQAAQGDRLSILGIEANEYDISKAGSLKGYKHPPGHKMGAITNKQIWISLVDGFISKSGPVANHNRSMGAPKEARMQLTDEQYELVKEVAQEDRLSLLGIGMKIA